MKQLGLALCESFKCDAHLFEFPDGEAVMYADALAHGEAEFRRGMEEAAKICGQLALDALAKKNDLDAHSVAYVAKEIRAAIAKKNLYAFCAVPGCEEKPIMFGSVALCEQHYQEKQHGEPHNAAIGEKGKPQERCDDCNCNPCRCYECDMQKREAESCNGTGKEGGR